MAGLYHQGDAYRHLIVRVILRVYVREVSGEPVAHPRLDPFFSLIFQGQACVEDRIAALFVRCGADFRIKVPVDAQVADQSIITRQALFQFHLEGVIVVIVIVLINGFNGCVPERQPQLGAVAELGVGTDLGHKMVKTLFSGVIIFPVLVAELGNTNRLACQVAFKTGPYLVKMPVAGIIFGVINDSIVIFQQGLCLWKKLVVYRVGADVFGVIIIIEI